MAECSLHGLKTLREKEKLLFTSNFSFSHSVFKRLELQTRVNQSLFGKWLSLLFKEHGSLILLSKEISRLLLSEFCKPYTRNKVAIYCLMSMIPFRTETRCSILTFTLPNATQWLFADRVDQDQTAQNVQSDLGSALSNTKVFSKK